jgi:hypothetical protein
VFDGVYGGCPQKIATKMGIMDGRKEKAKIARPSALWNGAFQSITHERDRMRPRLCR